MDRCSGYECAGGRERTRGATAGRGRERRGRAKATNKGCGTGPAASLDELPGDADDSGRLLGESGEGSRGEVERARRDAGGAHVGDGCVDGCARRSPDLDLATAVLSSVVLRKEVG